MAEPIKQKELYRNKNFSILGDSISTLKGYNPDGNKVFYDTEKCAKANINGPQDTWWGKVIDFFGGELLVNDSWSGSWAAKMPGRDELSFSGCSDERTSSLHQGDRKPDVIIVYLGTNDWYYGASPEYHGEIQILKDQSFRYAYNNMLKKLKSNYPEAEIWCCTLCVSDIGDGAQAFPFERMGVHMKVYCDVLKEVACENGCRVIDLYSSLTPYETVDGYHPSAKGMDTLAQLIIKEVTK